jgi:hypothetical protein
MVDGVLLSAIRLSPGMAWAVRRMEEGAVKAE